MHGFKVDDFYSAGFNLHPQILQWYPRLGWDIEEGQRNRNRTFVIGSEIKPLALLSVGAEFRLTDYEARESTEMIWQKARQNKQLKLDCDWRMGDILRLNAIGGYQGIDFYDSLNSDWNRFFGGAQIAWTPLSGMRIGTDINQSYRRVQLKDEQFRYVGSGRGSYIRDTITGNYIYNPGGDYERFLIFLGRFATAREINGNFFTEITRFEPASLFATLSEFLTRADTGVLSEQRRLDVRIDFHLLEPAFTPKVGFSGNRSQDRTLPITGKIVENYQWFGEMVSNNAIQEVDIQARVERLDMERRLASGITEYTERGWLFSVIPVIGTKLRLEIGLSYDTKKIEEQIAYPELGRFALDAVELWLGRTHKFFQRAKARTQLGFIYRWASVSVLPWDVALTRPTGFIPQGLVEVEYLFNEMVNARGKYTYTDRPDQPADQLISFEVLAYF